MVTPLCPSFRLLLAAAALASGALRAPGGAPDSPAPPFLELPLNRAFPLPGATAVCPDTPLRLTFDQAPARGTGGRLHIVDVATGRDVENVDIGTPVATQSIGGEAGFRYYPVILSGTQATIHPRHGVLAYGRKYTILMDAGFFTEGGRPSRAVDASSGWSFTTKPAPPPAGTRRLTIAADGTGDFCTVQGALDFIPPGNTTPTTLLVRRGTYTEIVFFSDKHALTLEGEDRQETIIAYPNNDRFNPSSGNPFGGPHPDPSTARHVYHRGVFLAHRAADLVLTHLTIRNTTPRGGSQAEALILNGTAHARAILKDVDFHSFQDTVQLNGQTFVSGCTFAGDVDFMWGTGPCFFSRCVCRSLRSGAYYTQVRNPAGNHGFVFDRCTFEGAAGVTGNYLSRVGTGRFPHSEVVLLDCTLTPAVGAVGWQFLGGREGNPRDPAQVHFWEFRSRDAAGAPVQVGRRLQGSRQLDAKSDASLLAPYRDPAFVLGDGWDPRQAPIFRRAPPDGSRGPAVPPDARERTRGP